MKELALLVTTLAPLPICFLGLFIGSITDMRTREVPDVVSFGLSILGFGFAVIATVVFWDISYLVASFLGFFLCFLLSWCMFYAGQWGGGDAKMLMAMGALLGLSWHDLFGFVAMLLRFPFGITVKDVPFLLFFFLLLFVVGGVYGTIYMVYLVIQHWQKVKDAFPVVRADPQQKRWRTPLILALLVLVAISLGTSHPLLRLLSCVLAVFLIILYYLHILISVVEKVAMIRMVPVDHVTLGDWVGEDVIVNGRCIVNKNDLGISEHQLDELHRLAKKGKIETVPVKYGIPFVPSFFLAFVASVIMVYIYV